MNIEELSSCNLWIFFMVQQKKSSIQEHFPVINFSPISGIANAAYNPGSFAVIITSIGTGRDLSLHLFFAP